MERVKVDLKGAPYDILIGEGLIDGAAQHLSSLARSGRFLLVTDSDVAVHVLPRFSAAMAGAGLALEVHQLPAGEGSKNWAELERLVDWLLSRHVERSDHIIALGGGVVGDITGFAAHIVKRGCHFVQVPTSLLAQVDSSVGGKTAINCGAGKNLVGAFHQPSLVLIDPTVLETLPRRELGAGYAEVVKYGLIDAPEFFDWCETNLDTFMAGNAEARRYAIARSVEAKARIVAADEKELNGTRALLNLGHTFGHALEAETGYCDTLLHGEGVAAGMALAFRYSVRRGHCPAVDAERVTAHLERAGLPTSLRTAHVDASGARLVEHMLHDKKKSGGTLPFLLANGIGKTFLARDVDLADVAEFLDEERAR
ncbi:MAG: 3-dehydroquinate synthase [Sphingobium sp.]|nr:MAG: 3-dehydroquinate synthase [Sphingobium sp.]